MQRYRNTRFSRPGERNTVPTYDIEVSPSGKIYYLSSHRSPKAQWFSPRVFWLHPTKGFRSQGART